MYKFGVSFNCTVGDDADVGGGGEGCKSLDYLSNDLDALKERLIADGDEQGEKYTFDDEHHYVGLETDVGGKVVTVMVTRDADEYCIAVVFDSPSTKVV